MIHHVQIVHALRGVQTDIVVGEIHLGGTLAGDDTTIIGTRLLLRIEI